MVALGLVARAATSAAPFPEATPARSPRRWALPTAVALGYLASAAISTSVVAPHSYNEDDRAYVEGLRADLRADPRVVVFDGRPPDNVMVSWFDDDARISTVVGIAPEDPVFDLPSYATRMVDPAGRLRSINLVGAVADVPPRDRACGHRVTADGFTRVRLTEPTGQRQAGGQDQLLHVGGGFPRGLGGRWRGVAPAAAGPQRGRRRRRRPDRRARAAPGGSVGCARRTRRCVWSASWSASRHRASGLRRRPVGPRWCRPSCPRRTDRSGSGPWCPGRRAARRRRAAAGACPPGRPGRWRGAP